MCRKDWILWIDKMVLKGDECLLVWLVFSGGQNSLLEIFLALYVLYVFGFYICIQRKFFKAYFYRLKNVCSVQNSKHDILQVIGSHEANVIVRIISCFLWLPSWATSPKVQWPAGHSHAPKFSISKSNSSLPPCISALLIFSISFSGFSNNWIKWFIWTSYPLLPSVSLQVLSMYPCNASHT